MRMLTEEGQWWEVGQLNAGDTSSYRVLFQMFKVNTKMSICKHKMNRSILLAAHCNIIKAFILSHHARPSITSGSPSICTYALCCDGRLHVLCARPWVSLYSVNNKPHVLLYSKGSVVSLIAYDCSVCQLLMQSVVGLCVIQNWQDSISAPSNVGQSVCNGQTGTESVNVQ